MLQISGDHHRSGLILFLALLWTSLGAAQQAGTASDLTVQTSSLPKGYIRQAYSVKLAAQGGTAPYQWKLASGSLPPGIKLSDDGELSGLPAESGEFHFVVTVSDSNKPTRERSQELELRVVTPLTVQWSKNPKISGQKLDGAIKISNQTGWDFDLTAIIVAVSENGRATAVGYQHFILKKDTTDLEIAFGETLPPGEYSVNVDVVGEVAAANAIYRARLASGEKLRVQQGP